MMAGTEVRKFLNRIYNEPCRSKKSQKQKCLLSWLDQWGVDEHKIFDIIVAGFGMSGHLNNILADHWCVTLDRVRLLQMDPPRYFGKVKREELQNILEAIEL